jgi:hypothetical protein
LHVENDFPVTNACKIRRGEVTLVEKTISMRGRERLYIGESCVVVSVMLFRLSLISSRLGVVLNLNRENNKHFVQIFYRKIEMEKLS